MNIKNLLLRRFVQPTPEPAWVAPFLVAFEKELSLAMVMKVGDHIRTNARYARDISRTPRAGVLLKSLTWITGLWLVRLDGFERPQHIHKNYLEKETKDE